MQKWECARCGRERTDKPRKNEICNADGCKGRFRRFAKCRKCGNWFATSEGRTFCDECREQSPQYRRVGTITVKCYQCGKDFQRYAANVRGKKQFCGLECQREYELTRWESRICKECGKTFKVHKAAIEHTNASGNYCSRECYNKHMTIEDSPTHKGGFDRVKREHFKGVQFCAICGTTKRIHIHHIIPFRLTKDNGLDNLVPLCSSHHKKVENATLPFINTMSDKDKAKQLLNVIIRARQRETATVLRQLQRTIMG